MDRSRGGSARSCSAASRSSACIALVRFAGGGPWQQRVDRDLLHAVSNRPALARLAIAAIGSAALFIAGLWVMGLIAPPFSGDSGRQHLITGGPFGHLAYIINFAKGFSNSSGAQLGYPWQWWYDHGGQTLLRVNPSATACHVPPDFPPGVTCLRDALPGLGPHAVRPVSAFLTMISPPILAFSIPALVVCGARAVRRRPPSSRSSGELAVAVLALAWTAGTWLPFELQNLAYHRISWLYYMIVVSPGSTSQLGISRRGCGAGAAPGYAAPSPCGG